MQQIAMAPRLLLNPFMGVDHQHRRLSRGRTRNHVLQEFLVSRRIDNQIRARLGAEPNLRRINGNALVPFGLKRIHDKRPFERHAALVANRLQILDLALGQRPSFTQDAPNQGGLTVVHMTDDDDTERDGGGHGIVLVSSVTLLGYRPKRGWAAAHTCVIYMYPPARNRSKASSDS